MLLVEWLVEKFPTAKRTTLKRMAESGRVRVNGVVVKKLKQEVGEGDKVEVSEQAEEKRSGRAESGELKIVHEDEDVLVVEKPHGLLTSTVPDEPRETLLARVREYVKAKEPAARVGLIHRLDKDAAGLLVFSKNNPAYESLKRQFFEHSVDRVYTAVVEGVPKQKQGRFKSRLVELPDGMVRSTKSPDKGQEARTEYLVLLEGNGRAMLRVVLETGRKHQIRAHLSEGGFPIVNDPMYGKGKRTGRLMLMATSLTIRHPRTKKKVTFELPIPEEFKSAVKA
jgi:RluA family pseudouridine synthase